MSRRSIYIKNMVSHRCIKLVELELSKMNLSAEAICLGMAVLSHHITSDQQLELRLILMASGLELMPDKDQCLIDSAIGLIEERVHQLNDDACESHLDYISRQLQCDPNHLGKVFKEAFDITIHQFIIKSKIDMVKELLTKEGLSITEIAFKLNYSSVSHLSNQFKKSTNQTPSFFKKTNHQIYNSAN